jgi:hypothetical protein
VKAGHEIVRTNTLECPITEWLTELSMLRFIGIILLLLESICFAQDKKSREKFISSFDLKPNYIELSRLAQPTQYFDKIGRRGD